jgi:hypothetical protein
MFVKRASIFLVLVGLVFWDDNKFLVNLERLSEEGLILKALGIEVFEVVGLFFAEENLLLILKPSLSFWLLVVLYSPPCLSSSCLITSLALMKQGGYLRIGLL